LVALLAVPMFAAGRNLVDDVIRMYKSGVPEESIVTFVQKADGRFDVSADDLIAMADAKVPRTVIKAVLDESDARNGREAVRDSRSPSSTTVVVERPYGYGYYDPYYYSPYWYPGFSLGLGFVGFYGGGHFGGGFHGGHGGFHGGGGHGHH
jgi:uncharacterized membrane protein YgcG